MPSHHSSNVFLTSLILLFLALSVFAAGYWFGSQKSEPLPPSHRTIFQRTIDDAKVVTEEKVSDQLWAINAGSPHIIWQDTEGESRLKVAAWMGEESFETHYKPYVGDPEGRYTPPDKPLIWVTLAPQVREFCQQLMASEKDNSRFDPTFRLKQFLGLNPNYRYERFVELWVNHDDLLRPCPDPDTGDHSCNVSMDEKNPPTVKGVEDYRAFFGELMDTQYQPGPFAAPWTRLGYTYDWQRGVRNVGASEFMLVPNAHYLVDASYTTAEYCRVQ